MAKKILSTVSLSIAGAIIGFILGAVLGFVIGGGVDAILEEDAFQWRSLYGGIFGAVTGLIAGAGTVGLGIRTRLGLEWVLIIGIGIPLGFWLRSGDFGGDIFLLTGIGIIVCWLIVHFARFVFAKGLPRGPLAKWVIAVYLLIFGLVVFAVPSVLQVLASIFYF